MQPEVEPCMTKDTIELTKMEVEAEQKAHLCIPTLRRCQVDTMRGTSCRPDWQAEETKLDFGCTIPYV